MERGPILREDGSDGCSSPGRRGCLRRSAELAGVGALSEGLKHVVLGERLVNSDLDLRSVRVN